jgi:hypothetical protein
VPIAYEPAVLRSAVQTTLNCADGLWYRYTLRKDVCGCVLSSDEERAVVDGAVKTAADMARQVMEQYGMISPEKLAEAMCLKLVYTTGELREPYLYMGLYEPDTRTITVNESAILLVRQFIAANDLEIITPSADITRIVLFHEIFHALEEEKPDIYTRSRMLERKLFGIFSYKRALAGVSEVGAVHFSKSMAGISYSPCIFERYLLLALGQLSIDFLPPKV